MAKRSVKTSSGPTGAGAADGRRGEILDAALTLIADQGFDSVTHRRVATAAGVPLGSTTYYFESRGHLLSEAFRRYLAQVSGTIDRMAEAAKQNASVRGLIDFLVEFTEREFQDEALLITEYELLLFAARDGSLAAELHAWQDGLVASLAEVFVTLGAEAPVDAARSVIHLVRGYEQEQLTRGAASSDDLRRRLEVVIEAYLERD